MPRMTPDLLLSTHPYLNPLKDRELELRGFQIPAIENLGVTKDSIDSLDLTDNAIRSLINLPKLTRLKHLYLSNNPITFISPTLFQAIPNLNSLILTGCQLSNFNQVFQILKQFRNLEFLVLIGNPISKMSFYRDWCVHSCTKLRILDYRRVKDQERKTSLELFYDPINKCPTDLAKSLSILDPAQTQDGSQQLSTISSRPTAMVAGQMGKTLTNEERDRIKQAIEQADTVEEVRRLKRMLEQGFIPKGERVIEANNFEPTKEVEMMETEQSTITEDTRMQEDSPAPIQSTETVVPMEEEEEALATESTPVTKSTKKATKTGGKKNAKATTKRKTRATKETDEADQ
ncbi:hypothetical protein CROQUDRAFT_691920 [Cronartium quercuum f. sp. fusiforme G11]|uniref:U2 small nuclear ribonucleoprotein A' n=1 Tax=Cronartium quercuum f. sp. fusiforme G11 TaxID=708437 RepID=A0A9P6T5S5_9BASI|nr:hypothetical protein CROQUDRAFT_691920 [Cronartium quercuum f. sp. fusiforme G11]